MNSTDLVEYFIEIFGIETNSKLIVQDIGNDLLEVQDVAGFREYARKRIDYDKYRFLKPYQKFTSMKNDFLKENKPKLNHEQDFKVRSYSEKLFSRVTTVFDEIDYRTKIGVDIRDKRVNFWIFQEFGEDEKALNVLNKLGTREVILDKLRKDRSGLEDDIKKIVYSLTLKKIYPQLENKKKEINVLEQLKKGK